MTFALTALVVCQWTANSMGRDKRLSNSLTIEQIKDRVAEDLRLGMSLEAVKNTLWKTMSNMDTTKNPIAFLQ